MKRDINTFIRMVKQIIYILDKEQKRMGLIVLFFIFLGALFEMLGISAVIPFIYSLVEPERIMNIQVFHDLLNVLGINTSKGMFLLMACGIVCIYVIKNLFLLLSVYVQAQYKCSVQKNLSSLMLKTFLERPYLEAVSLNCADVRRWIFVDTDGVFNSITCICKLCSSGLTILAIGIFVLYTEPFMSIGVLTVGGGFSVLWTIIVKKYMRQAGIKQREADTLRDKYVNQSVYGIKEVHVMHKEEAFLEKYRDASEMKRKADCQFTFISGTPDRVIEIFFVLALIIAVCLRVALGLNVEEFIPQLAMFAVAAFRILPLLTQMSANISSMVFYRPALEECCENVKYYRNKSREKTDRALLLKEEAVSKNQFNESLNLTNVEWRYEKNLPLVIENLNMEIKKGESIGLIGPSGAGKSTLSDIILGLLQPIHGKVMDDNIDIYSIPKQWSEIIGYVPQSIYLVDDTIKSNIAFGVDEKDINDQQIWKALDMAQMKEYVENLDKGINTVVGERGIKLSGGQRQRIAIARALYFDPDIIIFDEATSALDNDTERAVMESIDSLQGRKTLIIVAHRLSTIKKCNKIYEVNNGKVELKQYDDIFGK